MKGILQEAFSIGDRQMIVLIERLTRSDRGATHAVELRQLRRSSVQSERSELRIHLAVEAILKGLL